MPDRHGHSTRRSRHKKRRPLLIAGVAAVAIAAVVAGGFAYVSRDGGLSAQEHYDRAVQFRDGKDTQATVIELKNALQIDPGHAPARWLLGLTYLETGNGAAAEKELERALEMDPENAEAAQHLSDVLLGMAQPERLAEQLARAAGSADHPDRVAALWRETARLHADELENLAGAISALHRSLRAKPNDAAAMRDLAIRRVPVVDDQGALVGIVAMDDLLVLLSDQLGDLATAIREEVAPEG